MSRFIGYQANASSLDHEDLDEAGELQGEDISDWGERMIELNRRYGLRILGGCCGTGLEHLQYLVDNIHREQAL
ncbi:MAG: homocysteine S-methyltransferase family protein [Desulfohalobiaceae bacterium]|nr:homocysteine S-methyltransferase family protein [Desulfohalobiaceae bacterium]